MANISLQIPRLGGSSEVWVRMQRQVLGLGEDKSNLACDYLGHCTRPSPLFGPGTLTIL